MKYLSPYIPMSKIKEVKDKVYTVLSNDDNKMGIVILLSIFIPFVTILSIFEPWFFLFAIGSLIVLLFTLRLIYYFYKFIEYIIELILEWATPPDKIE